MLLRDSVNFVKEKKLIEKFRVCVLTASKFCVCKKMATFNINDLPPRQDVNAEAAGVTLDFSNSMVHNTTINDL